MLCRMRAIVIVAVVAVLFACTARKKEAWRESGRSWRSSGQTFLQALGLSIQGEGAAAKEEWKGLGHAAGEAGRDTADALGESVKPPPGESSPAR
jgi:hypothetical protein